MLSGAEGQAVCILITITSLVRQTFVLEMLSANMTCSADACHIFSLGHKSIILL